MHVQGRPLILASSEKLDVALAVLGVVAADFQQPANEVLSSPIR